MSTPIADLDVTVDGLNATRMEEGRALRAYQDVVNVWTVGYGLTNFDKGLPFLPIGKGTTITEQQAEWYLLESIRKNYMPAVKRALEGGTYANPQGAVNGGNDFHFNCGGISKASWPKLLGAGNLAGAEAAMMSWNKAGGRVLADLTRRRARNWQEVSAGVYSHLSGPEVIEPGANNRERASGTGDLLTTLPTAPDGVAPDSTAAPAPAPASNSLAPWHQCMEAILGMYRFASGDNPAILEMAKQCGGQIAASYKHQSTAWCALTVNYCLVTVGLKGNDSLWALDFRKVGTKLSGPAVGAIATKTRDGGGHVFLVRGRTAAGGLIGTGGNQSSPSLVCDEVFVASECEFNWPAGYPAPTTTGMDSLPVLTPRPHTHKDYTTAYVDHPALQTTLPALPAGPGDGTRTPRIAPSVLREGAAGQAVTDIQNALTAAGFPTPATGTFDAATLASVLAFQKAHPNLTADGEVGPATKAGVARAIAMRNAAGKIIKTATPAIPGGFIGFHQFVSAHAGTIALGVGLAVLAAVAGFYLWRHRHDAHGWVNSVIGRIVP